MKKIIKRYISLLLAVCVLVSMSSCERINDLFSSKKTETKISEKQPTSSQSSAETDAIKKPAELTTKTTAAASTKAPVTGNKALSKYLDILKSIQNDTTEKETISFLFDGTGNGTAELFIVDTFASRSICDVYRIDGNAVLKVINGCEIFNGDAEEHYAGVAEKDGEKYLFTYGKTKSGREYTVRYAFVDITTGETATVAEDFKKHDGSTEKSVHEYTVNGESVRESDYKSAYGSYTLVCATGDTGKKDVEKVGMPVSELIKYIEEKLK